MREPVSIPEETSIKKKYRNKTKKNLYGFESTSYYSTIEKEYYILILKNIMSLLKGVRAVAGI